jgi:hypothetical protein
MQTEMLEVKRIELSVPDWIKDEVEANRDKSTDELLSEIQGDAEETIKRLTGIAAKVVVLEERGIEWSSAVNRGWVNGIRAVAFGQLLPEALLTCVGNPALLGAVRRLPIHEQKRVASNEPFEVAEVSEDGIDKRMVKPSAMTPAVVKQVFGYDSIRDVNAQAGYMRNQASRPHNTLPKTGVVINKKKQCIEVSGDKVVLSIADMSRYISQLSS